MADRARIEVVRGYAAVEEDRGRGESLLGEIKAGVREWEALNPEERGLASGVALIELLQGKSLELRLDDPEEMVSFAKAACTLAEELSSRRYGAKVVADLQARAWAELGNAHRVAADLESAGFALNRARELVREGTGSPRLACRILELAASLLTDLRRFGEALDALRDVEAYYRYQADVDKLVRILVQQGHVLLQANEPEDALVVYLRVLMSIEPHHPLRLAVVKDLALCLVEAGFAEGAQMVLDRNRHMFQRAGRLDQYRLLWLEGKVAFALSELDRTEGKLNAALLGFQKAGKVYEEALVSLDLALLYTRQERRRELFWLVERILRTFRSLGIAREAIASLLLLRKSCTQHRPLEVLRGQIEALSKLVPELQRGRKRKT